MTDCDQAGLDSFKRLERDYAATVKRLEHELAQRDRMISECPRGNGCQTSEIKRLRHEVNVLEEEVEKLRVEVNRLERTYARDETALHVIAGPADRFDPFMDVYQAAGGGYEGLQAVARARLAERETYGVTNEITGGSE